MTRVAFSCPHPMPPVATGPGRPLRHAYDALLEAHGEDTFVFSPDLDVQAATLLADTRRLGDGIGPAFDDLGTRWLEHLFAENGYGPDFRFLGGGGASLNQLRYLRANETGFRKSRAGTTWFSTHFAHADKLLRVEYAKWGITQDPIHPFLMWRARREQEISDFLIVPSAACAETYPPEVREKVFVAEFGVDATRFRPLSVSKGRPEDGSLRAVMPGSNAIRKGLTYVSEAANALPGKVSVLVTGYGHKGQPINHAGNVHATGWVGDEDHLALLQNGDVLLHPSLEEGQALALLEGMACGLPVIATAESGVPFADGKEGILVKARDAGGIRDALQFFIDNPSELKRMGANARAFAEARPWSKFRSRIVRIMEEA